MKRKTYQRPTTMVVQLQQQCCILSGSGESLGKSATMTVTYEEEDI